MLLLLLCCRSLAACRVEVEATVVAKAHLVTQHRHPADGTERGWGRDSIRFEFESNIRIRIFDIQKSSKIEFESNILVRT